MGTRVRHGTSPSQDRLGLHTVPTTCTRSREWPGHLPLPAPAHEDHHHPQPPRGTGAGWCLVRSCSKGQGPVLPRAPLTLSTWGVHHCPISQARTLSAGQEWLAQGHRAAVGGRVRTPTSNGLETTKVNARSTHDPDFVSPETGLEETQAHLLGGAQTPPPATCPAPDPRSPRRLV